MQTRQSTVRRLGTFAAAITALLGFAQPSFSVLVPGGGNAASDCYGEFDVVGATGSNKVTCTDGDPACDTDGQCDGTCTFDVSVCVNQTNVPGCTPAPLKKAHVGAHLTAPTAVDGSASCTTSQTVPVKLKGGAKHNKKNKKVITFTVNSTGRPKKETDRLILTCMPRTGDCPAQGTTTTTLPHTGDCAANPAGGPSELQLVVGNSGTDLDNGWTGISHNFPVDPNSTIKLCLSGCDASSNPVCNMTGATGAGSINGDQFGAPLALLAAGTPVCVINRYQPGDMTGQYNVQTGMVPTASPLTVKLFSEVYLTSLSNVCPRCSGANVGDKGTCDSGANQGKACTTESQLLVVNGTGNKNYNLSRDCTPTSGQKAGTLNINLPLTTETSTLAGPKPCHEAEAQGVPVKDDNCGGSGCGASCGGDACATTANGQCVDVKGGISQVCCNNNPSLPCFPTATGPITRTGVPAPPAPVWPDPTYPKMSTTGSLVATFCEAATGTATIDGVTGLPGPGALILPGTQTLFK